MALLHLRSGLPAGMPRGSLRAPVFFICHMRGGMKNPGPATFLRFGKTVVAWEHCQRIFTS